MKDIHMKFTIQAVFTRSLTLELENMTICHTDEEVSILLDGVEVQKTRNNVVTVQGLLPDTEYEIGVREGTKTEVQRIRTKKETVLLNILNFGALGDGVTDSTAAIQAAILTCPDGGTIEIPEGCFFSKPLFLKSHITLWLRKGAVLLGNPDRHHYPLLPGLVKAESASSEEPSEYSFASWEGNPETSFASLITGIGLTDVDIIGEGTIDGNGDQGDWWKDPKTKHIAWRPNTIFLNHCEYVRLQGITVRNSPSWTVHPYYCNHMGLYNVTIWNPSDSPNTDGLDPESCSDLLVLGTTISVGDDCIAIKSGKYYMSEKHHKTAENIIIRNCILERGHGSVTIGSEAAAGVQNVEVVRCIFHGTDRGLRVKTRRGRGPHAVYDNIVFHHIRMEDVHMPFTFNMFYFCDPDGHSDYVQNQKKQPVDERTPRIGTIRAENIECTGADGCILVAYGLPEMYIENIVLRNVTASFLPKKLRKPTQTIMMDNFKPMTGKSIYARNVKKLTLDNLIIDGADEPEPELYDVIDYDSSHVVFNQ